MYLLRDHGFINLIEERESVFIKPDELPKLEQIVRFNRDLEINLEGIEVIFNLLERVEKATRRNKKFKKQDGRL